VENLRSREFFKKAAEYIPGGVNTSIRRVEPPIVFSRAKGSKIYDVDGNEYIDYHMAFGPPILGHCHPKVNRRVFDTLDEIDLIGAGTTELEAKVAEKIVQHVPSAKKVLFCNAGSEATYSAVRVSRAHTKRKKIIKFQGCYHGWSDYLAMNVISEPDKLGKHDPLSAGSLPEAIENTIVLEFNNLKQVEETLKKHGDEVAAIILEPIQHNIGCILPRRDFLRGLRELADRYNVVLIFDEVITGFRHNIGGYQKIAGVTPDLTTLGKSIANGYPCAALCGREDIMDRFTTHPKGDVFFAGTYNAHPLAMAAALATIEELEKGYVYEHIFALGDMLRKGLSDITETLGLTAYTTGFGSVFVTYFMEPPAENYTDLLRNNKDLFVTYRKVMMEHGVFMTPLNLKRNSISAAHTEEDVKKTLDASQKALEKIKFSQQGS